MALIDQATQEALKKLVAGNPSNAPVPVSGFAPGGVPLMSGAQPQTTSTPQRVPKGMPSDDPQALSPLPTAPNYNQSPVADILRKQQSTLDRIAAVPRPDPNQLKPHWYDRLLAFGVGTAAGLRNPEDAATTASNIVNRRWNQAETGYQRQISPLQQQLQMEREQLPAAEAAAKIPQTDFENRLQVSREERERAAEKSKAGYWEQRSTDLKDRFIAGSEAQDENSPTGWTAETFGGEKKPFTPKSLEGKPKEPTNEFTGWYEAFNRDNKRPPTAKEINDHMIAQKHAERPEKPEKEPPASGWSPDESREITSKGRRYQTRITELEKQRATLMGATDELGKSQLAAINEELEGKDGKGGLYGKIDDIENEVLSRRKGGNPAATPEFPKGFFKGKEGKRVTVDVGGGRKMKFDIQADGTPKPVTGG